MDTSKDPKPPEVPERDKQGGDVRARWARAAPEVWTDRMLDALEKGVKGGKWFSLIDKVGRLDVLYAGFGQVEKNGGSAGVDGITVETFGERRLAELERLSREILGGTYQPRPVKRVYIPKPGSEEKRPLGIPTVRDRAVQASLRRVIEPIFEAGFADHSYGFRPGRGCKDALREVDAALEAGKTWVVDADLKSYFDTIPHGKLMERVKRKIADGRVLDLILKFLKQGVLEELKGWEPTEQGTPQGAVISPLLANLYLDELDHLMAARGRTMIRYADDFVILCADEAEARAALDEVKGWVEENGLLLHPEKTRIVDATVPGKGFDFLGYHFERGMKWPRIKNMVKLRGKIREATPRKSGVCLAATIQRLNRFLKGWFEYFKHSHKTTFPAVDQHVRMRLRSLLRKRRGGQGRGRGLDHYRWPNAYFAGRGLFSLKEAHGLLCQQRVRELRVASRMREIRQSGSEGGVFT
jgi:RNA-directed DNA polymerase